LSSNWRTIGLIFVSESFSANEEHNNDMRTTIKTIRDFKKALK
jgi:hypothetical protein